MNDEGIEITLPECTSLWAYNLAKDLEGINKARNRNFWMDIATKIIWLLTFAIILSRP